MKSVRAPSITSRTATCKHCAVVAFDSLAATTDRANEHVTNQTPQSHRTLQQDRVHDRSTPETFDP